MPCLASIFIILTSFILSLGLTAWVRKILIARALLDHPNERSSHKEPVPRGGGWALLAVLIPGMIVTGFLQNNLAPHAGMIAGVFCLAFISWRDDKKGVSPLMRLSLHILAACLGSMTFSPEETLFAGVLPFWLDRALMIIGWAWFINLYNFMDGIDGITCTETIAIATGICLLMITTNINDPFIDIMTLLLTGVCLGFLALNWHPAKIFMGDVGSVPLGFLTGYALLTIAVKGYLVPALILPLYYLADSGITLARRALRGEKVWQAHREHFYQRAALVAGRHNIIVYWILLANIVLAGMAIVAVTKPWTGFAGAVLIVAILLYRMQKSKQ